jgi:hypothetical protein
MSIEKYINSFREKFGIQPDNPLLGFKNIDLEGSCNANGNIKDLIYFLRTSLKEYGREVRETPELPMGASNWLEHGIKYGYLEHFNLK